MWRLYSVGVELTSACSRLDLNFRKSWRIARDVLGPTWCMVPSTRTSRLIAGNAPGSAQDGHGSGSEVAGSGGFGIAEVAAVGSWGSTAHSPLLDGALPPLAQRINGSAASNRRGRTVIGGERGRAGVDEEKRGGIGRGWPIGARGVAQRWKASIRAVLRGRGSVSFRTKVAIASRGRTPGGHDREQSRCRPSGLLVTLAGRGGGATLRARILDRPLALLSLGPYVARSPPLLPARSEITEGASFGRAGPVPPLGDYRDRIPRDPPCPGRIPPISRWKPCVTAAHREPACNSLAGPRMWQGRGHRPATARCPVSDPGGSPLSPSPPPPPPLRLPPRATPRPSRFSWRGCTTRRQR